MKPEVSRRLDFFVSRNQVSHVKLSTFESRLENVAFEMQLAHVSKSDRCTRLCKSLQSYVSDRLVYVYIFECNVREPSAQTHHVQILPTSNEEYTKLLSRDVRAHLENFEMIRGMKIEDRELKIEKSWEESS